MGSSVSMKGGKCWKHKEHSATVLLTHFYLEAGIGPWVAVFVVYVINMMWIVQYQNTNYIDLTASGGEEIIGYRQTIKGSLVLKEFLVSVP